MNEEKILITQKACFYSLNTETTINIRIKEQIHASLNRTAKPITDQQKC